MPARSNLPLRSESPAKENRVLPSSPLARPFSDRPLSDRPLSVRTTVQKQAAAGSVLQLTASRAVAHGSTCRRRTRRTRTPRCVRALVRLQNQDSCQSGSHPGTEGAFALGARGFTSRA